MELWKGIWSVSQICAVVSLRVGFLCQFSGVDGICWGLGHVE